MNNNPRSFAARYNSRSTVFTAPFPNNAEFKNLSSIKVEYGDDVVIRIHGFLFNEKTKFDPSYSIVTAQEFINAPSHRTRIIEAIFNDPEAIEDINNGLVGIKLHRYTNNFGEQYSFEFVDLLPDTPNVTYLNGSKPPEEPKDFE